MSETALETLLAASEDEITLSLIPLLPQSLTSELLWKEHRPQLDVSEIPVLVLDSCMK